MKLSNKFLFIIITTVIIIITFLSTKMLNTDELLYNSLTEQLSQEQTQNILESQEKWAWAGYVIIPLLILLRSSLVATCISIGHYLYHIDEDISIRFKHFFKIALQAEVVLLLVGISKLVWFAFIDTSYTLQDLQQFYPLSATIFLDMQSIDAWLLYPLQTLNLFEIAYWFALAYGLFKLIKGKFWKSFEITMASYGTGLIIWVVCIMFFTLSVS